MPLVPSKWPILPFNAPLVSVNMYFISIACVFLHKERAVSRALLAEYISDGICLNWLCFEKWSAIAIVSFWLCHLFFLCINDLHLPMVYLYHELHSTGCREDPIQLEGNTP